MNQALITIYIIIFLFGIVIGSFLNVCILRIPLKETIVSERSHCMKCGVQLAWYDLVPLFSWLALRGRCRNCKKPISPQYPIVEGLNGFLYLAIFMVNGLYLDSILYCLLASALLVIAVIDWRTFEIPVGCNIFIAVLGILRIALAVYQHARLHISVSAFATPLAYLAHSAEDGWLFYILGALVIGIPLLVLYYATGGSAIGGGDVKLMAAAGLLLGWKLILLAFFLGCILGSIIHILRMRLSNAEHVLAMGPYLAAGILLSALWGNGWISWYLTSFL